MKKLSPELIGVEIFALFRCVAPQGVKATLYVLDPGRVGRVYFHLATSLK